MKTIEMFKNMLSLDNVLILTHKSPDADTLGTAAALKRVYENNGKRAYILNPDRIRENLRFITGSDDLSEIPESYDHVVSVDVATENLFGKFKDIFSGKVEYSIDHHLTGTDFAKYNLKKTSASSVGEYLAQLLEKASVPIDRYIASRLYIAITGDTGCFKYSNVTPVTMKTVAKLLKYDVPTSDINRQLFEIASLETILMENQVLLNAERYRDGHITVLTIDRKITEKTGDELNTDGIIALTRRIKDTVIGLSFKEMPDGETKVSLRSLDSRIDVSSIAVKFGGGGHKLASGCTLKCGLKRAKKQLLEEVFKTWDGLFGEKEYDNPVG